MRITPFINFPIYIYMLDSFFRIFTPAMVGYLIGNLHVKYQLKKHIEKNTVKNPIYDDQ